MSGVDAVQLNFRPRPGFAGTNGAYYTSVGSSSFDVAIPAPPGWYDVDVQAFKGGAMVGQSVTIERVGVGDVFVMAGQSNMANCGSTTYSPPLDNVSALNVGSGAWVHADDPQPSAGSPCPPYSGSVASYFGQQLATYTGYPVGVVLNGVGGSSAEDWNNLYATYMQPTMQRFSSTYPIRSVLWQQGETPNLGATSWYNSMVSVITKSRATIGYSVDWGIANTASWIGGSLPTSPVYVTERAEQNTLATTYSGCYSGANTDSLDNTYRYDGTHFNGLGQSAHATMWKDLVISRYGL